MGILFFGSGGLIHRVRSYLHAHVLCILLFSQFVSVCLWWLVGVPMIVAFVVVSFLGQNNLFNKAHSTFTPPLTESTSLAFKKTSRLLKLPETLERA